VPRLRRAVAVLLTNLNDPVGNVGYTASPRVMMTKKVSEDEPR
jgi:hypothetical protein